MFSDETFNCLLTEKLVAKKVFDKRQLKLVLFICLIKIFLNESCLKLMLNICITKMLYKNITIISVVDFF